MGRATTIVHLAVVLAFLYGSNAHDTQCHQPYTNISEVWRSTANEIEASERPKCDRNYIVDDTWYRFISSAGNEIPTTDPGFRKCGTFVPIWMNGRHPLNGDGVIDATACAGVPFRSPKGCGLSYNIKVVNCSGFYLYRLKNPQQCALAYCAGSEKPVACSTTGTSLPVCSGVVPNVEAFSAGVLNEPTAYVRLKCEWKYDGNASIVEFHVRWIGDKSDLNRQISKIFNGTEKKEFLYEHETFEQPFGESDGTKYAFNKEAFCEIRSRFIGGSWSKWMRSRKIYTGITVHPTIINLDECGNEKYRKVFIALRPNLPIRNTTYKVDINLNGPGGNGQDNVCLRGIEHHGACQFHLKEQHSSTTPLRIMLRASCSRFDGETGYSSVDVKMKYRVFGGNNNPFWQNYIFPKIKIFITNSKKSICKSVTDPHFTTFDGRYYNFYGIGTFLLYYNKHIGTRIEARHKSCGRSFASCNCAIAIKEGAFYKIFDMCQVDTADDGSPWWTNPQNLVILKRGLKDSQTNGFYTTEQADGSKITYKIYLPSGVVVTIMRMYWGLTTHIRAPTPFDTNNQNADHHSEGLCGNYNGIYEDDFVDGQEVSFAESYRINDATSLFGYKGDKILDDELLSDCNTGEICVCNKTHVVCGQDAITQCFPEERSNGPLNTRKGLCEGPAKRDLTSKDDDIDDEDDIPPFNPPQQNVSRVPSWPTPGGLTEVKAKEICNEKIRYSKAGESCGNITGVDINAVVEQCLSDIQATDDIAWATDNFAAMQETCKKNIYKNTSFYQNTTDGKLKLDTSFIAALCPDDCSGHGNCSNSTCTCDEFYTAADCSISLKEKPYVSGIKKNGLCDVRRRPCRNVGIYGFPFLDSKNLTCHVQEYKVIESVWTPNNFTSLHSGKMVDLTEVKCSLPESPVNIGDYGSKGVTAAGLKIKVSNNGINASMAHMLFITYDSVCQECNTINGCRLKSDACFISGHCFAQNESHPNDWCRQCLPYISSTSWLKRRDNQMPSFTTSSLLYAFRGKQLRVQLRAIDPEYRTIRYSFAQNVTFGASLTESGVFTWTKNINDSTIFLFKVTDECGAYSVLNVSIVIKECPCLNSGECFPDYRYLDGAGNFTCSCPAEYTGGLCDADVDECALSKRCLNGNCNNEQPGFSCSCFAGYTGDLCQNEIDECASNPCFVGVPCTDKIASYSCGQCPHGYSGNGQTCSRIDGKVDQCVKNPQVCHSNARCTYNNGSYVCQCTDGFTGDGKNNCTDVDECIHNPNACNTNANCTNTEGSYSCKCLKGYTGDGSHNCSDIDECTLPDVCIKNAQCSNTVGSYVCQCAMGYSGDGYNKCTDINECNNVPMVCRQNATCTNFEGSYSCQCDSGYTGDGKINCTDINECSEIPNVCHRFANCSNTLGSYSCHCITGFSGDGQLNCDDFNECEQSPSVCHPMAKCFNTEGTFSCKCGSGYTGDGLLNCTDVNECSQSGSVCNEHAECTNTIGSYSCQCKQGFFRDVMQNCTENKPPRFITPSTVYALLNNDVQIQVMAEDPENQHMTFTLLSNGTFTTARITEQLLTISNLNKNGTVFVQVEDEIGGKTILILQVHAFECPCKHNGQCYQKSNISYAVQQSDYLCRCEDSYTGDHCEKPPNPCEKLPCYPGLQCSRSPDSEEFTCEKCPPLFEGDGKKCELKSTKEQSVVESELTLTDQVWDDDLKTKASQVYKNLVSQLTVEIRNIYKNQAGFSYVIIKGFRRGSIIVNFQLIFVEKVEDPLKPLMEVTETGKLGNMTVKMKTGQVDGVENKSDSKEDNIFGLDKTIFYVIVGAAAVFILVISLAIYLRIKRLRTHREAKLRARILEKSDGKAQGIAFQPAAGANSGEEIDLKVFDNEAICLEEEIKLGEQP